MAEDVKLFAALIPQIALDLDVPKPRARVILQAFGQLYIAPLTTKLKSRGVRELLSRKNPYLYRASGVETCEELIDRAFGDYLSSSTETLFGNFLEAVAIAVGEGVKSATQGIDIERRSRGSTSVELYVLKSGPAGFNSASLRDAERALQAAEAVLRQGGVTTEKYIAFTYGRKKTTFLRGIARLSSQDFWSKVSGSPVFYIRLLEACQRLAPLYETDILQTRKRLLEEALQRFCDGKKIHWAAVLDVVSGGM